MEPFLFTLWAVAGWIRQNTGPRPGRAFGIWTNMTSNNKPPGLKDLS